MNIPLDNADNETYSADNVKVDALKGNDSITNSGNYVTIDGGEGADDITNSRCEYVSISGGAGMDLIINNGNYVTINGGAGNDTIYNYGEENIYQYANGDGKDSIFGIKENDTLHITSGSTSSSVNGNDVIIYVGSGSITLKDSAEKSFYLKIGAGKAVETVFSDSKLPYGWKYGTASKSTSGIITATLNSNLNNVENIDLNEPYGNEIVTVDASKASNALEIIGHDDEGISVKGGKGGDTISGGTGNDTVSLGGGNDVYIYQGGDDIIQNYAAGHDSIQVVIDGINSKNGKENIERELKNGDVIYTFIDSGTLIIKKVDDFKDIVFVDINGDKFNFATLPAGWKYGTSAASSTDTKIITATTNGAEDIDLTQEYGEGVEKVDASKTSGIEIYGNDLNNYIKGSKNNDVISGGGGNDTVSLGGGSDLYIYGGGDDSIQDYESDDKIQIDTNEIEIYSVETETSKATVYTDKGNLILNFKTKKSTPLTLIDHNEKEISFNGRIAENVWFLEDDNNFETCAIDDITENKFAVTEIQSYNNETFAQDDNILTFAKEK